MGKHGFSKKDRDRRKRSSISRSPKSRRKGLTDDESLSDSSESRFGAQDYHRSRKRHHDHRPPRFRWDADAFLENVVANSNVRSTTENDEFNALFGKINVHQSNHGRPLVTIQQLKDKITNTARDEKRSIRQPTKDIIDIDDDMDQEDATGGLATSGIRSKRRRIYEVKGDDDDIDISRLVDNVVDYSQRINQTVQLLERQLKAERLEKVELQRQLSDQRRSFLDAPFPSLSPSSQFKRNAAPTQPAIPPSTRPARQTNPAIFGSYPEQLRMQPVYPPHTRPAVLIPPPKRYSYGNTDNHGKSMDLWDEMRNSGDLDMEDTDGLGGAGDDSLPAETVPLAGVPRGITQPRDEGQTGPPNKETGTSGVTFRNHSTTEQAVDNTTEVPNTGAGMPEVTSQTATVAISPPGSQNREPLAGPSEPSITSEKAENEDVREDGRPDLTVTHEGNEPGGNSVPSNQDREPSVTSEKSENEDVGGDGRSDPTATQEGSPVDQSLQSRKSKLQRMQEAKQKKKAEKEALKAKRLQNLHNARPTLFSEMMGNGTPSTEDPYKPSDDVFKGVDLFQEFFKGQQDDLARWRDWG